MRKFRNQYAGIFSIRKGRRYKPKPKVEKFIITSAEEMHSLSDALVGQYPIVLNMEFEK